MNQIKSILNEFGLNADEYQIKPFGNGLINLTWKISGEKNYILQQINTGVFLQPEAIAENLLLLEAYLKYYHPDYLFVAPIPTLNGSYMVKTEEGYFRIFPFIENSATINEVRHHKQAYEAARQFGKLTLLLKQFDPHKLKYTLTHFHDLNLRFEQFQLACSQAEKTRLLKAYTAIRAINRNSTITRVYQQIIKNNELPLRVIHHDAKINNVLFDKDWNGMCLVDLDTVMPGHFISDTGDMLRTYLSPVGEEESDLSKIKIDEKCFYAIYDGYMSVMGEELTPTEREYFVYSGKYMIYMQAMRFLTDYLNGDAYYHTTYEEHNLNRTHNQLTLLYELIKLEYEIFKKKIVKSNIEKGRIS